MESLHDKIKSVIEDQIEHSYEGKVNADTLADEILEVIINFIQ